MVSSLKPNLIDLDYVLNSGRKESAISDGSVRVRCLQLIDTDPYFRLFPSLIDLDYVLNSARKESAISDGSVRVRCL